MRCNKGVEELRQGLRGVGFGNQGLAGVCDVEEHRQYMIQLTMKVLVEFISQNRVSIIKVRILGVGV